MGFGDALPIDRQDVEVHQSRAKAHSLGVAAKSELETLEVNQQILGGEIGVELEGGVHEIRLVEQVARSTRIERRGLHHGAHPPQLRDGARQRGCGLRQISPESDEGAHSRARL